MQNKKLIISEIELTHSFKMLSQAYEEIAVIKMHRIRGSVLLIREFLDDLSKVFHELRVSYQRRISKVRGHKKKKLQVMTFTTLAKNGKSVAVLLSPNGKLYGDIPQKVYNLFIQDILKSYIDIVIVGRIGKALYDQSDVKRSYQYFEIPDSETQLPSLIDLISYIMKYEKVQVYYGRFLNIVNQLPTGTSISGDQISKDQSLINPDENSVNRAQPQFNRGQNSEVEEVPPYLFEPTLDTIYSFFETQIFTSLFKQAVHESHLAQLGSRIHAMEDVLSNIDKTLNNLKRQSNKIKREFLAKKQHDTFAGISLWGGKS